MHPETVTLYIAVFVGVTSELLSLTPSIRANGWIQLLLIGLRAIGDSRRSDRARRR
jgi:hypothetical protein